MSNWQFWVLFGLIALSELLNQQRFRGVGRMVNNAFGLCGDVIKESFAMQIDATTKAFQASVENTNKQVGRLIAAMMSVLTG